MQDRTNIRQKCAPMPVIRMLGNVHLSRLSQALALTLLCALIGCDRTSMMRKMIPAQDATLAEHYMDAIRHKEYETVEQHADPSIAGPDLRNSLADLAAIFPDSAEDPASVKPVAMNLFRKAGGATNTSITLEYEFSQEWVLAEVTTQKVDGIVTITGVHAKSIPESVESQNGFNLKDKGLSQYFVLLLAIATPLFTLYALILCIKTRIEKRKWLWMVFILVGVGRLTVNWTTGQLYVMPFAVHLLSGGASAFGYAPWMIYVSLPIGAIIFFVYRDSISASSDAQLGSPTGEPTS
jgi:hypothetical protein